MGQSTTMKVMKIFVKVVREIFDTQYVKNLHEMILRNNSKSMIIKISQPCLQV
jgi:hypothetical protein